jgi:hypothetical protein
MSAFFPVLLFLTALILVVLPITPYGQEFVTAVKDPKIWQNTPFVALTVTIVVMVLSVMLYNMNTQIVRLYEGYPWKDAWIAKPFLRRRKRQFSEAERTRQRINTLRREVRLAGINADLNAARDAEGQLARLMNNYYPDRIDLVLPTRLGNVIRAFETYTTRQYGMPAINLWPRLQAVVDGNLAQSIDGAKTSFDFMIHSAFLSGILAVFTAGSGLYWKTREFPDLWQPWLAWTILLGVISYVFYLASIPRAFEWGTQVKAAFDLFRFTLLLKLGYESKPTDPSDERRIWENLNYKFAFPDDRSYPDLPYKTPASYLIADPSSTVLKSIRTVTLLEDGSLQVRLVVTNLDPAAWDADQVIVREAIPAGKLYVRDSATVNGAPVQLSSIDPLEIDLGALPHCDSRTIVYRVKASA